MRRETSLSERRSIADNLQGAQILAPTGIIDEATVEGRRPVVQAQVSGFHSQKSTVAAGAIADRKMIPLRTLRSSTRIPANKAEADLSARPPANTGRS